MPDTLHLYPLNAFLCVSSSLLVPLLPYSIFGLKKSVYGLSLFMLYSCWDSCVWRHNTFELLLLVYGSLWSVFLHFSDL